MKRLVCISFLLSLFSCGEEPMKLKTEKQYAELPEASSYPLELDMSQYANEFIANCQTCHTARYIEMQPDFPRKTWVKIVDKMVHAYGAPIDSLTAQRIVDYLVWVQDQ